MYDGVSHIYRHGYTVEGITTERDGKRSVDMTMTMINEFITAANESLDNATVTFRDM